MHKQIVMIQDVITFIVVFSAASYTLYVVVRPFLPDAKGKQQQHGCTRCSSCTLRETWNLKHET